MERREKGGNCVAGNELSNVRFGRITRKAYIKGGLDAEGIGRRKRGRRQEGEGASLGPPTEMP